MVHYTGTVLLTHPDRYRGSDRYSCWDRCAGLAGSDVRGRETTAIEAHGATTHCFCTATAPPRSSSAHTGARLWQDRCGCRPAVALAWRRYVPGVGPSYAVAKISTTQYAAHIDSAQPRARGRATRPGRLCKAEGECQCCVRRDSIGSSGSSGRCCCNGPINHSPV